MTLMRGICRLAVASLFVLWALSETALAKQQWPEEWNHSCNQYEDEEDSGYSVAKSRPRPNYCPKVGKLKIRKIAIGGDADFKFTVKYKGSFTLRNGETETFYSYRDENYQVEEINLPEDWSFKSVSCSKKVYTTGRSVTVHVEKGETVTCTYTNFKGHDDKTRETTELFIRRRIDNLLTNGPDRARLLRRLEPVEQVDAAPLKFGAAPDEPAPDDGAPDAIRAMRGETSIVQDNRSGNPLFDGIATQLTSAFAGPGGQGGMHFQASLSGLKADAAAAAARDAARKSQSVGAGFETNPYTNGVYVPRSSFDVWVEGRISSYDDDNGGFDRDGRFRVLYVGADYILAPGILVGVLGEVDDTTEDFDNGTTGRIEGTGWSAGPYVGVVLGEGIYFDARAAWGTSDNDIDITDAAAGNRTGSFDTDRWLAKAQLTANKYWGAWRFTPQLGIAYGEEEFDTYITTLGQTVDGDSAHLGIATSEIEVGYRFITSNGSFIEPTLSVEGIWTFDSDDVEVRGVGYGTDETRAKVEAGLIMSDPSGFGLRWSAAYDGIGASDYDAWQGSLWINVPLN